MDIPSTLANRTRWQPGATAAPSSGPGIVKPGQTVSGSQEYGYVGTPTGETLKVGALTATGNSTLGALSALALPSAESVAADKRELGQELTMVLAVAGIKPNPPIDFALDGSGAVTVDDSDPRAPAIREALANQPDLSQRFAKLIADAQMMEHGAAVQGWYGQVNAGTSGDQANRNLVAAAAQINAATGFTLGGDGLSLEVEGMGAKLMQVEAAPPTDDEKMWRETLRLTERTGEGGVIAAANAEEQLEAAQRQGEPRRQGKRLGRTDADGTEAERVRQAAEAIFRRVAQGTAEQPASAG